MSEAEEAKGDGIHIKVPADVSQCLISREEFERRKAYVGFERHRITYSSDGLKVAGYLWKPVDTAGKRFPLIIYNRGGIGKFGMLTPRLDFYAYLSSGFVVLASQFRGNDGGEGRDECGGADVRDVLNLLPLARSLGYVDMNNVFMLGWSRGAMMTYLALKQNMPVNAVAVRAGLLDLVSEGKRRPALVSLLREMNADFDQRGDELMRERSAVHGAEHINVPMLILQGGADWRADPGQALDLAKRLQELGRTYELILYADDDHFLSLNRADGEQRTDRNRQGQRRRALSVPMHAVRSPAKSHSPGRLRSIAALAIRLSPSVNSSFQAHSAHLGKNAVN